MKRFWAIVAKYAVKVAVYSVEHPDQIAAIVDQVKR